VKYSAEIVRIYVDEESVPVAAWEYESDADAFWRILLGVVRLRASRLAFGLFIHDIPSGTDMPEESTAI
jgi:hypothetical protein